MSALQLLVVAGDPSGDLHAANLIKALKRRDPETVVAAVGGPLCRDVADEFIEDLASRGVTGFWEPALKIGFLLRLAGRIKRHLTQRRPDAVICVDYYGFNRRVLSMAKAAGVPAYYYVSPQVWASRKSRISVLKKLVRRMLVIFPFEEELYRESGVPVEFVGHPLLDVLPETRPHKADPEAPRIGLLPGSRNSELGRHLHLFYDAFKVMKRERPGSKGYVFASSNQHDRAYGALPDGVTLVRETDYEVRKSLDLAICSSGTATLENALLGVPMVVVYKLSWPTYAIARAIVKVKHIAMANLLAGREVVPELIQREATVGHIVLEAARFLDDPDKAARTRAELARVRSKLGEPGAAGRAAASILSELKPRVPS